MAHRLPLHWAVARRSFRRYSTYRGATFAGAEVVRVEGPRQWLRFHRDKTTAAELIAGIACTTPILDLTVEEPLIEDVIAQMYSGNRTGGPSV